MKNSNIFQFLFIATCFSFLFASCRKETALVITEKASCVLNTKKPIFNTNSYTNLPDYLNVSNVCGLFPLGKNYQWIYRDSIFDNAGQFSEILMDTLSVEKTILSLADSSVFWKLKCTRQKGIPNYVYAKDSVLYFIDRPYGNNNASFIATEWLKIYPQDSITKFSFVSDYGYRETIQKVNTGIKVPAGVFEHCIKNTKSTSGIEEIIFKPEFGIVKFTKYSPYGNPFNPVASDKRMVSELVSCRLQ